MNPYKKETLCCVGAGVSLLEVAVSNRFLWQEAIRGEGAAENQAAGYFKERTFEKAICHAAAPLSSPTQLRGDKGKSKKSWGEGNKDGADKKNDACIRENEKKGTKTGKQGRNE